MPSATVDRLPYTGDDEADRLLAESPLALLIGFALDQQVTVQKAFSGPAELRRRLGHLDAARIAATPPEDLDRVFRERPALHRFLDLPGIGEMKARTILSVLGKRLGVSLPGMADVMPTHQTLGDVDSPEALASYQAGKRAYKAEMRAQGKRV